MDCKEFERMIPDFVDKKLDYAITKCFVEHLHNCPNCKEELNIQFLIEEGLVRLEEGSAFDLQKEMRDLLNEAGRKIRFHERCLFWGRLVETIVILGVAVVVLAIIIPFSPLGIAYWFRSPPLFFVEVSCPSTFMASLYK